MAPPTPDVCPGCGDASPRRFQYPEGCIWICGRCRLQWGRVDKSASGGFIPTTNEHYLAPASFGDPYNYPPYVDFFRELAAQRGDRPQRILDIGCGAGGFVMHCLQRGHDAWGVEANANLARFMTPEALRRVHFGLAEEFPCQGEPFDVITFWDSFEHIEQAFELLDRLRALLKPGGLVYIRVNNTWDVFNLMTLAALKLSPALGRRLLRGCFNFPDHCWNFSRPAMRAMLEGRGWRMLKARTGETPAARLTSNPLFRTAIHMAYLMNRLLRGGKIANYYVESARP